MTVKWRFSLVAIIAVAVLGGVMPHAIIVGAEAGSTEITQVAEVPLSAPLTCLDATCGKGSPASPAPSPVLVLVAVVGGLAALASGGSRLRRRRLQAAALPAGVRRPPFRPPQFS